MEASISKSDQWKGCYAGEPNPTIISVTPGELVEMLETMQRENDELKAENVTLQESNETGGQAITSLQVQLGVIGNHLFAAREEKTRLANECRKAQREKIQALVFAAIITIIAGIKVFAPGKGTVVPETGGSAAKQKAPREPDRPAEAHVRDLR